MTLLAQSTFIVATLLTGLAGHAQTYTLDWEGSTTLGCSNKLYVSRFPFSGNPITNAMWSGMLGTTNRVTVNLTQGVWRLAVVAVLSGSESDPALLAIDVPSGKVVPEAVRSLTGKPTP